MRTITTLIIIGTALAACTVKNTTVKQAETPPPVVYQQPPVVYQQATAGRPATVAYTVIGQEQLNQAAGQAANWCRANYGTNVRLVDRAHSTAGDVVTFACMS
jgi:hypothetical protein